MFFCVCVCVCVFCLLLLLLLFVFFFIERNNQAGKIESKKEKINEQKGKKYFNYY